MLLRAGVGWKEGYVGQYQGPPKIDTPIGHAFVLSEPVAIPDYASERIYRYPAILKDHGCVASLNVPLRTDRGNFGVLELDHTPSRPFSADDVYFLTGLGNTSRERSSSGVRCRRWSQRSTTSSFSFGK